MPNDNLLVGERVLSAGGAAFISAVIFNPLDVVKCVFLIRSRRDYKAQAAGVPYQGSCRFNSKVVNDFTSNSSPGVCRITTVSASVCSENQYKGKLDVLYKIIRQEGFSFLSVGDVHTNASLALACSNCWDLYALL